LKRIIITAVILFAAIGFTNAQSAKVAFVDSETILKQLPETAAIQREIEGMEKLYMDTLTTMETNLKTLAEDFKVKYENASQQASSGNLSEAQAKSLEAELKTMQDDISKQEQDFYAYRQGIQQVILKRRDELFKPVIEKITKQIEIVAKEMKFQFVFDKNSDALLYGDKQFDITFDVLKKLNN
jgi:outer membrane protein